MALLGDGLVDDEYFHILVAENWWKHRELTMLDGVYTRGALFTKLVAASFGFFGEASWEAARTFPSLISGILMVGLMSWWVHREVGVTAGLSMAVLLILWPDGIEVSQFARFYALHGLLFCLGVILFYYACTATGRAIWQRGVLLAVSGLCLFAALELQVLTIAGLAAVGLWFAIVFVLPILLRSWTLALLAVVAVGLAALAFFSLGYDRAVLDLWSHYRALPPGWSYDPTFYHRYLRDSYPTLWPLLVLVCVIALTRKPRLALLCIAIFLSAFLMLSFGHRFHMRYLYHAVPFLFVIWAIVLQSGLDAIRWYLFDRGDDLSARLFSGQMRRLVALALVALVIAFALFANAAFPRAARLALGSSGGELLGDKRIGWPEAYEMVLPWAEKGALLLTSRTMISTAYIGDFDVAFSRLSVHDIGGRVADEETLESAQYIIDPRDGRALIGDRQELLRLIRCTPVGVAISPVYRGDFGALFFVDARDLPIELTMEEGPNVRLIGWRMRELPDAEACRDLPIPQDGGAAARIVSGRSAPTMGPSRP